MGEAIGMESLGELGASNLKAITSTGASRLRFLKQIHNDLSNFITTETGMPFKHTEQSCG
jgi:hypothetical protein